MTTDVYSAGHDRELSPIYIPHPQATEVLEEMEFMLAHLLRTGEALGWRLTGPTNAGKSTVVKELWRRYPCIKTPAGYRHPVLYIHLVERARLAEVYSSILHALGDPAYCIGTAKDLKERVRMRLKDAGVKLLIIDEPHHLTDAASEGARLGLTQFGKWLIDARICFVFAGVKSVDDLVRESDELARRFRGKLFLGPYRVSNKEHVQALRDFCNEVGSRLRDVEPIQLGNDNTWFGRLLAASNGLVGVIAQIVNQAESRAQQNGDKKLTMKHMSLAWTYFSHSHEEGLQHLKTKSRNRLLDVFAASDTIVEEIIGGMASAKQH